MIKKSIKNCNKGEKFLIERKRRGGLAMFKKTITAILVGGLTLCIFLPKEFTYASQDEISLSYGESNPIRITDMLNRLIGKKGYLEEADKKVIENVEGLDLYEINGVNKKASSIIDEKTKYFLDYELNPKMFSLRDTAEHVEIWVANDLSYPEDDLRNADSISADQINKMKKHFEEEIYPAITKIHGAPEFHKGENAWLVNQGYLPEDYYVSRDDTSRMIILVDNIKDGLYYQENSTSYIPGYYWSVHKKYMDRDIIIVNSKDWEGILGSIYLSTLTEETSRMMEDKQNDE